MSDTELTDEEVRVCDTAFGVANAMVMALTKNRDGESGVERARRLLNYISKGVSDALCSLSKLGAEETLEGAARSAADAFRSMDKLSDPSKIAVVRDETEKAVMSDCAADGRDDGAPPASAFGEYIATLDRLCSLREAHPDPDEDDVLNTRLERLWHELDDNERVKARAASWRAWPSRVHTHSERR